MSSVIALKGVESEKVIDNFSQKIIPFVGADRPGEISNFGIGYSFAGKEGCVIWGLVMPHALIKSWRGMKLLEGVSRIEHGTLCDCWTVCGHNLNDSDQRHKDDLAQQFASREEFESILEEVLNSVPTPEDLSDMISVLLTNEVSVDSWDLVAEIEAGRLEMTDQIQAILDREKARSLAYKKEEEECKRPIPREESLSAFFEDLGIDYFIVGGGFGGYGIDWGHIKREELDCVAQRDSFSKYLKNGHKLERTTSGPKTTVARAGQGVTAYQTSFGDIEKPFCTITDGTKYIFISAKWLDGKFYVRTLVKQKEMMVPPEAAEFTIAQLRQLLNVKRKTLFKRMLKAIFG